MNFTEDYVRKALKCCPLLPPPGDREVRLFAQDWLEMHAKLKELEAQRAATPRQPSFQHPAWAVRCGGCGEEATTTRPLFILTCPRCGHEGCEECMPGGPGAICAECREADDAKA